MEPAASLRVDPRSHRAFARDGRGAWRELALTQKEFAVLSLLLRHPGSVLSRAQILHAVWGAAAFDVGPEAVDKRVGALRRKLGAQGSLIKTAHGRGYGLDAR